MSVSKQKTFRNITESYGLSAHNTFSVSMKKVAFVRDSLRKIYCDDLSTIITISIVFFSIPRSVSRGLGDALTEQVFG